MNKGKSYLGLLDKLILEQAATAPPLPEGWFYDFDIEKKYNYEKKCWEFVATMIPRQREDAKC